MARRYESQPSVTERRLWNQNNVLWAALFGLIVILIEFATVSLLDLSQTFSALLGFVLVLFYSIVLFFLLEPHLLREIRSTEVEVRTVEKPVIKEVVRTVEKP